MLIQPTPNVRVYKHSLTGSRRLAVATILTDDSYFTGYSLPLTIIFFTLCDCFQSIHYEKRSIVDTWVTRRWPVTKWWRESGMSSKGHWCAVLVAATQIREYVDVEVRWKVNGFFRREKHYKMMAGFCLSVRLSVACLDLTREGKDI